MTRLGLRINDAGTTTAENDAAMTTEVPRAMRHIEITRPGGPEVLALVEAPTPRAGKGEVLIRVAAAGVSRADILQRMGHYPPPPGASPILGLEVSGQIVEMGEGGDPWKVGDHVCALVAGGGYAEYCAAPAGQCLPVPKAVGVIDSAAMPETYFTVWQDVFVRGHLSAGETILIHGGSSGIGTTAIQLARAFGARVLTTAGTDEKCDACRKLGADTAINYRSQDFVAKVRDATAGAGVNVILDIVGADYLARNFECLALDGCLLQIATQSGAKVEIDLAKLMQRGINLSGSALRSRSVAQKSALAAGLREHVWPLLGGGLVKPIVYRRFPLADAAEAHRVLESSERIGKILLTA